MESVGDHVVEQHLALLDRALADHALAEIELLAVRVPAFGCVAREQPQARVVPLAGQHVKLRLMRAHDRRELRENHLADRHEVALALEHAAELREVRLQPILLSILLRRVLQVADHLVDRVLERRHFALGVDRDRPRQVALRHRSRDVCDGAHLRSEIRGELVHVLRESFPDARGARDFRLPAELAFHADLARHGRYLVCESRERFCHAVDRLRESRDLALRFDGEFLLEIAVRDRRHHLRYAAHLRRQVARHEVHVVREVLPYARDALHVGLAAKATFRADLACNARHFRGERRKLIDHRVDRVLELEDLALHVDRDLSRQVAGLHGLGDVCNVADLRREITGHEVHGVREIAPCARNALHVGLAAELAFGAHLARDSRDFRRERAQLIHHRVDRVLELEDLALHVHRDLFRQIARRPPPS